jgi:transposase
MPPSSRYYDTAYKKRVVNYYITNQPSASFRSVATLFEIKGGFRTVYRWYKRRRSLETKPRSGRPTILKQDQINTHIGTKIRRKNRQPTAVHYPDIIDDVKRNTRKQISLSTIRRYGHKLGIKKKKTSKRTIQECNYTHI